MKQEILKINNKSDFQFQYLLGRENVSVPFKIIFYTIDIEDNFYEIWYDGNNYKDCVLVDDGESVLASLNNPSFYPGNLRLRVELYLDSASFEDGVYNQVYIEKTNVYIVTTPSNCHNVIYEGSNIASLDAYAIEQNVERVLNGIQDKSDEMNSDLEAFAEQLERLSDTITGLEEFQENIDSLVTKDELSQCGYVTSDTLGQYMTEDEVSDYLDHYYDSTYINSYYYNKEEIDSRINEINTSVDLSSYVSYSYLESKRYIRENQLNEYATQDWVHAQNYITLEYMDEMGNVTINLDGYVKYADVDFNSYVTKTGLSELGYITMNDVSSCGYITVEDIPTVDLSGYVSKSELSSCGYLTQHQSLSDYVQRSEIENAGYMTSQEVTNAILNAQLVGVEINLDDYVTKNDLSECGYITSSDISNMGYVTSVEVTNTVEGAGFASESYVIEKIGEIDLSGYVSKPELSSCGYLTSHQSLDDYATKLYVEDTIGDATSLLDLILGEDGTTVDPAAIPALTNYVTKIELNSCGYLTSQSLANYATKNYVDSAIENASFDVSQIDLSSYVSKAELSECGYITAEDIPTIDLTGYATESYVTSKVNGIKPVSYTIRNTYNLSVWSGTLTQYNALANHTSYQLYLIAEG